MSFADETRAALPEGLHLPDAFADTFDWLEAQGWRGVFTGRDPGDVTSHYLSIYPPEHRDAPGASHVLFRFEAGPPLHAPPPEALARVATLATIAGDGGTLSLWLDEEGTQRIVVFDHGEPHLLTDDPVSALLFLAIGYPEPAAITDPTLSAPEIAAVDGCDPPLLPTAFRAFLTERFGRAIPDTAAALGITIPGPGASDPVRDWLDSTMPEPEVLPMPGDTPDNPFIITRGLREVIGEDAVALLRETFQYVVEEE
jgi:hypothetical protein